MLLHRVLETSWGYEASRRLLGAHREVSLLIDRVLPMIDGQRVLDFGCGYGRLAPYLPSSTYVGVDNNPTYIERARQRYASESVSFVCSDVESLDDLDLGEFDVVVALGVLHHLDEAAARSSLAAAARLLRHGGRIVTMDPCFEPTQAKTARVLMALDRGAYVRHPPEYRRILESATNGVEQQIWGDVFKFPYTHLVQVGSVTKARAAARC